MNYIDIGHKPYRPQLYQQQTKIATSCSIWATRNVDIGQPELMLTFNLFSTFMPVTRSSGGAGLSPFCPSLCSTGLP